MYIVSLREGSICQAQGLQVEFNGAYAHVHCTLNQREKFWAIRLEFLRSNPNN